MAWWARYGGAFIGATMLLLAFPPFNLVFLVFVALVPWYRSLTKEGVSGWKSGLAFGFLYFLGQMFWLVPMVTKWTGNTAISIIPWILSAPILMIWMGLTGHFTQRMIQRNQWWFVPLPFFLFEVARSLLPHVGFPAGVLASPLAITPQLIQLSSVATIHGVSLMVAAFNAWVAHYMGSDSKVPHLRSAIVLMLALMTSLALYVQQSGHTTRKVYGIGQIGEDIAFGDPATEPQRVGKAVAELQARMTLAGGEGLFMSESMGYAGTSMPPDTPFGMPKVPMVFGLQRTIPADNTRRQSIFVYDDGTWDVADKTRLVVFGEYVPVRAIFGNLSGFNLGQGDIEPGRESKILTLGGVKFLPMVCFEALFCDIAPHAESKKPQFLSVHSVDDWFLDTPLHEQLWQHSVFRAVESGLPLIRSSSLGTSGWIDTKGNVRLRLPLKKRAYARAEVDVPLEPHSQPWRIWVLWALVGLAVVTCGMNLKRVEPA